MTNRIAIYLGVILVCLVAWDNNYNDGALLVFLGRQFLRLIEWVAVWR